MGSKAKRRKRRSAAAAAAAAAQGLGPAPARDLGPPPAHAQDGQSSGTKRESSGDTNGPSGKKRRHSGEDQTGAGKEVKRDSDGIVPLVNNNKEGDSNEKRNGHLVNKVGIGPILSIRQSDKLNERHAFHFSCLCSLITSNKGEPEVNLLLNVIHDEAATHGIYIEWSEARQTNFIELSRVSRKTAIKLELLAVFNDELMDFKEMKPLLCFSKGFGCDEKWDKTKVLLQEVFGPPDACLDNNPSHIYAFTKVNEKFCIRIFKINSRFDQGGEGFQLQKCGPSFVLKPEMLHDSNGNRAFVDQDLFCMDESTDCFHLKSSAVIHDTSCSSLVPHLANGVDVIFLPSPPDTTQWEGYNITASEFFSRYYAFRSRQIPGSGPKPPNCEPILPLSVKDLEWYNQLSQAFKIFSRSLIICCDEEFAKPACFEKIVLKNILFRGNKLRLLGVKQVEYSDEKAAENLKQVKNVITDVLEDQGLTEEEFPLDLKDALRLLEGPDAVANLDRSKNHICWMDGLDRMPMLDDIYDEFNLKMSPSEQLEIGNGFPDLRKLQEIVGENWLLEDCYSHDLPDDKNERNNLRGAARANLERLFPTDTRRVRKEKLIVGGLTRQEVEFVVSTKLTEVYLKAQEGVTSVWGRKSPDDERGTYARYGRYFQDPERIKIREEEKRT